MATLARWQRPITDGAGNIMPGASVEVRNEEGGGLAAIFTDRAGLMPRVNPFTVGSDGLAAFHAAGGAYKVTATLGSNTQTYRYEAIGTASEADIDTYVQTSGATFEGPVYLDAAPAAPLEAATKGYVDGAIDTAVDDAIEALPAPTAPATKAEQEAAASTTAYVSPARQQSHPSAPKAWVKFNGTGTPAILASYNVASITDRGVGKYTVNFTVPFSSAQYAVVGSAQKNNTTEDGNIGVSIGAAGLEPTASSCPVTVSTSGSTPVDSAAVYVAFFGDQ